MSEKRKAGELVRIRASTLERLKALAAHYGVPMSDLLERYVPKKVPDRKSAGA